MRLNGPRTAAAWRRIAPAHPAQVIVLGFAGAIAAGTAVLMLPAAKQGPGGASLLEALFTATSAVCVTGLSTVDVEHFWTPFGHTVIMVLIQVGGFGVMSFGTLLGILLARRLGLRSRISTAAETRAVGFGDLRAVLLGVLKVGLATEAAVAAVLTARFMAGYGYSFGDGLWHGVFHAVSAFNNAGFALFSDNLIRFAGDPWICLPIAAGIIIGGIGFPVLFELRRHYRTPQHWTITTKLVLSGTLVLLAAGTVFITALEWNQPGSLGPLPPGQKVLAGFFQSTVTRTAGFNSVDIGQMHPATWLFMDILMFIGGGSAGTAGGLKITTFAVLFFIMRAEIRGEQVVNVFNRRLSRSVHREAITVVLLAVGLVVASTMVLMLIEGRFGLDRLLFESVSAFATVGLTTGITGQLGPAGQLVLVLLMFVGRLGPVTLASALALRQRPILFEFPKERPLIG
ncbi:TrkH family potassium uptake protein [Arthrobacter sp. GCM10027362]|uniref:TrkH family potassium uptake protein n=1 Tax=Arthrobacter sp. GCM10027362 TaxID=3273379 RepID=UPI003644A094